MDKRFCRLGWASLILSVAGYALLAMIFFVQNHLSVVLGGILFGLWVLLPLGGILCSMIFRSIYGKAKHRGVLSGMISGCVLLWIQACLFCVLLFDGQDWSNTESTALIMFLVPTALVAVCVALYFSFRKKGQARVEFSQDLLAGVSVEGFPGCFSILSVRKTEWREETVGAYYVQGTFSLRETVRYRNSGEETVEKQVDLPEKYAKKHSRRTFAKLLAEQFPDHSFDAKLVSGAYYRMK